MNISDYLKTKIYDLCIQEGKTLYELAKASGIPLSTLKDISSGRSKNPGIKSLIHIAEAFDMELFELLQEYGTKSCVQQIQKEDNVF